MKIRLNTLYCLLSKLCTLFLHSIIKSINNSNCINLFKPLNIKYSNNLVENYLQSFHNLHIQKKMIFNLFNLEYISLFSPILDTTRKLLINFSIQNERNIKYCFVNFDLIKSTTCFNIIIVSKILYDCFLSIMFIRRSSHNIHNQC